MTLQEKINQATIARARKLFDRHIKRTATQSYLVRIIETPTGFRTDVADSVATSTGIEAYLDFPPEMPILRSRLVGQVNDQPGTMELTLWDLLPIGLWVKTADKVAEGDILVHTFFDEYGAKIPLIMKVTQEVGAFHSHLVWHKFEAAIHNGHMEPAIIAAIQGFLTTGPV